jgi:hypothetical protein
MHDMDRISCKSSATVASLFRALGVVMIVSVFGAWHIVVGIMVAMALFVTVAFAEEPFAVELTALLARLLVWMLDDVAVPLDALPLLQLVFLALQAEHQHTGGRPFLLLRPRLARGLRLVRRL